MNWRTSLKIAWREAFASRLKFAFVIFAVAAGVGALTGVRGFSAAFARLLSSEARTLMAADMSLRQFVQAAPDQLRKLDQLSAQGIERAWITETITMAAPESAPNEDAQPLLVSVKAIEPERYPFYGDIALNPPGKLAQVLDAESAVASADLLLRMGLKPGERIRIGGQPFRIAAILDREPDRMTGSLNVGPRLMLSRAGLDRAALVQPGSRAAQRYLFKLPRGANVETIRRELKAAFPEALIADYRETHPLITRGLNRATTFLSLVSLIALIVGALGVAMAMHSHLQQRLDSIAIMKCIGARNDHVLRIYVIQTIGLGLAGGLAGVLAGALIQLSFPRFIARYFQTTPEFAFYWPVVAQGLLIALFSTLLFTVPPLLAIRQIRPILILRRDMAEQRSPGHWRRQLPSLAAGALLLAGIGAIAAWLGEGSLPERLRLGAYFAAGLAVSLLLLAGVATLLLNALRRVRQLRVPASVRHGLANLYRPGNQAAAVLVALGIGVMFTLTVYLVQTQVLEQLRESAPPGMANVFLIDIRTQQKDPLVQFLLAQPGVDGAPEIIPATPARIVRVNGRPTDQLGLKGFERRFLQTRTVTSAARRSAFTEIRSGHWPENDAEFAIAEDAAKALGVRPGSTVDFSASGVDFQSRVACVYKTEEIRLGSTVEFIFPPGRLQGLPLTYFGGARVRPDKIAPLQRAAYKQFPNVTVVNIADVLEILQEVVDQISVVIRFVSGFAILAGAIILAAAIAGTRFRRLREVAILKTLGGTRPRIRSIFSVEFLVLGGTAGLLGSVLATVFSQLILRQLFDVEPRWDWIAPLAAIAGSALLANAAGWLASAKILDERPLAVLRSE